MFKKIYEAWLMLQYHWLMFRVRLDPVARNAELSPEESAEIWEKIQKEIRAIEERERSHTSEGGTGATNGSEDKET